MNHIEGFIIQKKGLFWERSFQGLFRSRWSYMVICNPEKRFFRINSFLRSCIQFDIQLFTLIRGRKRYTVYDRIRWKTAVLRFIFRCNRWPFFDVYYTASHDRNTVPAKRAIYGRKFTVFERLRERERWYAVVYDRRKHRPGLRRISSSSDRYRR